MTVTDTTLDGWFKDIFGGETDLVPDFSIVAQDIPFKQGKRLGEKFIENVRVRRAAGFTFYGSGLDAFALNAPVSGQRKPAELLASQFLLREQLSYGVVSAGAGSKEAFGNTFSDIVADMTNAAGYARELMLLYGGSSIGTIGSISGAGTAYDAVISEATWAPGLWVQLEGASLDFYDAPGGTKVNTNAAVVITGIDTDTRTISLTGNAADLAALAADDVAIPYLADGNWADGLDVLVPNTGTMHGINAATYSLWAGNSYPAGSAALTFAKLQAAHTKTMVRGGMGKTTVYMSPYTWTDLNDDAAALRRYVSETKGEITLGTESIRYFGVAGELELKPHPMVKAGEAFGVRPSKFKRIGSTDITFSLGVEGQQPRFFRELPDNAGFELRTYWHQALMNCMPAAHFKITGIDNDSL